MRKQPDSPPEQSSLHELSPYLRLAHIYRPGPGFSLRSRKINDYALLYFKRGSGRFLIGKTSYPISPGVLFVIPPDLVHSFILDEGTPPQMLNLHFDPVQQEGCEKIHFLRSLEAPNPRPNLKRLPAGGAAKLPLRMEIQNHSAYERLFHRIERVWTYPDTASRLMVKSLMLELLALLYRQVQAGAVSKILPRELPQLEKAADFMKSKLDRPLQMGEVARQAGISRAYFSTCFSAYYGISPAKFHLQQRIGMAANALVFDEGSIKEIAERFGFQTIHHFTRCFSRVMDMAPAAYRDAHRQAPPAPNLSGENK